MEQFSLEKYLQDPTRKVVTRNGYPVRIICTDREPIDRPVVSLVCRNGCEELLTNNPQGRYSYQEVVDHNYDLFFAPQKQSRWVFMYKNCLGEIEVSCAREDKSEAAIAMRNHKGFALTEITWEE